MLKRRNFTRYNTIDNVVPPLNTPTPLQKYPQFIPEVASFQNDNFLRDANSYSTIDFQMLTNSISYTPNQYRKAMYQGIDLFLDSTEEFEWVDTQEDEELIDLMRPYKRVYTDYYGYNESEGELDTFILTYTPYRIWAEFTRWLGSAYYFITGEQLQSAVFTYYYFYYYFLLTEYIYEHVCLYFPALKMVSEYQLFSTFEGAYFNFYEIVLGCYLPVIFIFYFSQYHFFKSFYTNRAYFVFGNSLVFYFFSILPVFLLTGYSTLLVFFTFCIFFCIASAFFIFEIRPTYFVESNFRSYSSYFLPAPNSRDDNGPQLCLPPYHFTFRAWPTSLTVQERKARFTRFPFTQNVKQVWFHNFRLKKFHLNRALYATRPVFITAVQMPLMGLIFPKSSGLHAYSFKTHKNYIVNYPTKDFMPFSEHQDHEYYNEIDQEFWPIHIRDFINHPGGFSYISFLEFVGSQKSLRSADYQFSILPEEEQDFYNSIPSKKLIEYLYPYAALRIWLLSLNANSDFSKDEFFRFKNFEFNQTRSNFDEQLAVAIVPNWLKFLINSFFKKLSQLLDFFTFFTFYNFSTPSSTGELASKLFEINQILVKDRRVSAKFYRNFAMFLYRSAVELRKLNVSISRNESYYFTYLALLRQFEEVFFNLSQKRSNYSTKSSHFRYIGLCLRVLRLKLDGFSRINI